ncbi:MAG: AzlD domain-containing protein [Acidimicrobiia bacterium]|nr:AzlD domain-containing protein [Acidimicrobiia bacterium]
MTELAAVLIVGIGTYFSRSVFIVALSNRSIPQSVMTVLQFVAPAVLAALVVALLTDGETGQVALGVPEAFGLVAGGFISYRTRNHVLTLAVGMAGYWLVRAVLA